MQGRRLRPRLTYANVMSTVAVFLALTGGATAIAMSLPKNSVGSKQIKKGAVTEAKIAKEAVTGPKVKISTFPKVPSAAHADTAGTATSATTAGHADSAASADSATTAGSANALGGTPASAFPKEQTVSSEFFTETLTISVSGFGSFGLRCHQNNVGNNGDDTLGFIDSPAGINSALQGGLLSIQTSPVATPELFTFSGAVEGGGEYVPQNRIIHVQYEVTVVGTNKTMVIEAGGYDNSSNPGCAAQIHAFTTS
ncbi:MAG TPA: hypothetical protein VMH33_09295 [Solirubrobacterales bacterium]|nr:hypothetical protein [Solirubrobacterales bacterium]